MPVRKKSDEPWDNFDFAAWRKRIGWSKMQCAAALEKSISTIIQYENGSRMGYPFGTWGACSDIEWYLTNPVSVAALQALNSPVADKYLESLSRFVNRGVNYGNRGRGRPKSKEPT